MSGRPAISSQSHSDNNTCIVVTAGETHDRCQRKDATANPVRAWAGGFPSRTRVRHGAGVSGLGKHHPGRNHVPALRLCRGQLGAARGDRADPGRAFGDNPHGHGDCRDRHEPARGRRGRVLHHYWRPSLLAVSRHSLERLAHFDLPRWICHRHGFGRFITRVCLMAHRTLSEILFVNASERISIS